MNALFNATIHGDELSKIRMKTGVVTFELDDGSTIRIDAAIVNRLRKLFECDVPGGSAPADTIREELTAEKARTQSLQHTVMCTNGLANASEARLFEAQEEVKGLRKHLRIQQETAAALARENDINVHMMKSYRATLRMAAKVIDTMPCTCHENCTHEKSVSPLCKRCSALARLHIVAPTT